MATHLRYWFGVSESMFTLFMALTSGWACSIAWKLKLDVSKAVMDCNRMNVDTSSRMISCLTGSEICNEVLD